MTESARLARQLECAMEGGAWHGPSWREVLGGVDADAAGRRPIPAAHSIVEVLGHAATWNEVVRRRVGGETPNVSNEENWPTFAHLGIAEWEGLVARFFESGVRLREIVAAFPDARLHEARPDPATGTWQDLILGQLQHLTYHAGQVALLRKAG